MGNKVEKFEDLNVWQDAIDLCVTINISFKECKDFSFRDQIYRASVSVPSNIAEGFERQYNKEFIHFLFIAKGSIAEVRTQLIIASKLNYLKNDEYLDLLENSKKISAQLFQLIKTRKEKFN